MFTFYKNSQKGQDLVEYALMLAIIIGSGWGIYSQTGVADSIKNVFGNASSLMETAKKNTGTIDMKAIIDRIDDMQKGYHDGNLNNGMDYRRGLIQSGWLKNGDETDPTIGKLGATMWTYYNGQNPNKRGYLESGVLYWTTEDLDHELDEKGTGFSNKTVLSYRYDSNTGEYSVIENRVWKNQPGADNQPHNGLAQLPVEYTKPAGTKFGPFSTYEEAQKAYKDLKEKNGGYIYTKN